MSIYIKIIISALAVSLLGLITSSCEKSTLTYNSINKQGIPVTEEDSIEEPSRKDEMRVNFIGNMNEFSATTDYQAIPENRYVTVYAYEYGGDFVKDVKYYTKEAGTLTPVDQAMYLISSLSYSLYGAGVDEKNYAVPVFTYGTFSDLEYNTDYIWADIINISPTLLTNNYSLLFRHRCTQVVVVLYIQDSIEIKQFSNMQITPSVISDIDWNLYYGYIGPSTSINQTKQSLSFTQINDTSYMGTFIMPPLKVSESTDLSVTFDVSLVINSVTYSRTYEGVLPVVNNYLQADTAYHYKMRLREDTVLFDNVRVQDWVKSVDGTPIIPDIYNITEGDNDSSAAD